MEPLFLRVRSLDLTILYVTILPFPAHVSTYFVCIMTVCMWMRLGLGEFRDSKGSMEGGDSQPIIFSLMVPGGQGEQQQKCRQETSTPDKPAPPSLHGCHTDAAGSMF